MNTKIIKTGDIVTFIPDENHYEWVREFYNMLFICGNVTDNYVSGLYFLSGKELLSPKGDRMYVYGNGLRLLSEVDPRDIVRMKNDTR